jgi:hypothetical protein
MKKSKDWCRITYLRRTIRDRKTTIVKDKNGVQKGGVTLTDETIKPYLKQLDDLEAKIAKDKENMSTGERVDTAAAEVIAGAEQNKDEIKQYIAEQFAKAWPKKFRDAVGSPPAGPKASVSTAGAEGGAAPVVAGTPAQETAIIGTFQEEARSVKKCGRNRKRAKHQAAMTRSQDWKKITYLRKTIKERKTKVTKDRNGNPGGGIILTDETIKPYLKQLDDLEGKMAETRRQKLVEAMTFLGMAGCGVASLATSWSSVSASTTLASPAPSPEQIRREALLSRIRAKDAASTL